MSDKIRLKMEFRQQVCLHLTQMQWYILSLYDISQVIDCEGHRVL